MNQLKKHVEYLDVDKPYLNQLSKNLRKKPFKSHKILSGKMAKPHIMTNLTNL